MVELTSPETERQERSELLRRNIVSLNKAKCEIEREIQTNARELYKLHGGKH